MSSSSPEDEREKIVSKLPPWLRKELKVRAAQLGIDIQDAVAAGVEHWMARTPSASEDVDTAGAESFSTWLPVGMYDKFRDRCTSIPVSYIQGLAQAVTLWLTESVPHDPGGTPDRSRARYPRRIAFTNQKGGVGKTALAAGIAQAYAESGLRVLIVDYDPQGHLTAQMGIAEIDNGEESLARHIAGEAKGDIRDLIVTIKGFDDRLDILPACMDGFLLDVKIAALKGRRERALEKALDGIEDDYDVIIVDCPPSLGLSMDVALYYVGRRPGEQQNASGVLIPVLADTSSAKAYKMLMGQLMSIQDDFDLPVDILGLVVNLYDSRKGVVVTSSLKSWKRLGDPPVLAVINDLKEQREAVSEELPLLVYSPDSEQARLHRKIAKMLAERVAA